MEWDPDAPADARMTGTVVPVDGFTVPVQHLKVNDFRETFKALGSLQRRFPARMLRHLKEHIYELVLEPEQEGRTQLYVQPLETTVDLANVEVVLGVGAIEKFTESYKGKNRDDLLRDVVHDGKLYPQPVIEEVLLTIQVKAGAPIYKYLRKANLLTPDGQLVEGAAVHPHIAERIALGEDRFLPPKGYREKAKLAAVEAGTFSKLADAHAPSDVLMYLALLPSAGHEPEAMRKYLADRCDELFVNGKSMDKTLWAKAVCLYD